MNVLVTGGAGFVGSVLIKHLLNENFNVKCLDKFFFGDEYMNTLSKKNNLELIHDDIRTFNGDILDNVDAVIDLAAISNDPAGELEPTKTYDVNHKGRVRVANLCKKHGVKRYILSSSISVYGFQSEIVNEESPVNPLTTYSKANRNAELEILPLNDDNFCVTVLRFSSIYGKSPRMRFDLAVNNMALDLFRFKKLIISGDGSQSRPFLHINDAASAFQMILESSVNDVSGEIFNVGSDEQNYSINRLSEDVGEAINIDYEKEFQGTLDHRSYTISFKKIRELGFNPKYTVNDGSKEIFQALVNEEIVPSKKMWTLKWYKHLIETDNFSKKSK